MVAVLASPFSQIERSGLVEREELGHAVAVVKMRMAQNADVHFRKVHAHHASVLGEQVRRPRVEQVAHALEFHVHREAPLAKELAGAARAGDIVNQYLNFHIAKNKLFAIEAGPFHNAVAAILGARKTLAGIALDVNQESELARVLGAAAFTVAVSALVVNRRIDGAAILAQPEGLQLVLVPVLFVNGDDVVLPNPFLGLLVR